MNRTQLAFLCLFALLVSSSVRVLAQTTPAHRAVLVVQYGDGTTEAHCVRFSEDALTGEQLLRRAHLPLRIEYGSLGTAVCKIGPQGCNTPAESCFCQCQTLGADCHFWNYLQQTDTGWRLLPTGAATRNIIDNTVFGWSWSTGDGERTAPSLNQINIDAVCAGTPPTPITPTEPPPAVEPAATTTQPPSTSTASPTTASPTTASPTTASPTVRATITTTSVPVAQQPMTAPAPAVQSTAIPQDPEENPAPNPINMLAFGALVLAMIGLLTWTRRKR